MGVLRGFGPFLGKGPLGKPRGENLKIFRVSPLGGKFGGEVFPPLKPFLVLRVFPGIWAPSPKGVWPPFVSLWIWILDVPIIPLGFFFGSPNSPLSLTELVDKLKKLQHKINAIENVAKPTLKGAHKRQYNIQVDMGRLSAYHLSMGQIMKAVQSVAVNVPDVKGKTKDGKLPIFGVKNAIDSVEDVKSIIVANYMGSPIYLRDVATVEDGIDIQNFKDVGLIFKQGNKFGKEIPQVTMTVAKLAGTNAVFVAKDVEEM